MLRSVKRNGSEIREVNSKIKRMTTKILQSPLKSLADKKEYRLIKLSNGLKALLIHHDLEHKHSDHQHHHHDGKNDKSKTVSESEKSATSITSEEECDEEEEEESDDDETDVEHEKLAAAALTVGSGSFLDPVDYQGLAHFTEHMIFMGSSKYPKENEFDEFLSLKGGSSNALTECEHTLFYFDIVEQHLSDALDRFSSLFESPLMSQSSINREIEAVESEFQNVINHDDSRLVQLFASMADDKSVARIFTWGNLKSLKDEVDVEKLYRAANEYRVKNYVASNMCFCIESAKTLDELQALVEENFSALKSEPIEKQVSDMPASDHFKNEFYEKMLVVKPKGDRCKLIMTFVMPSMEQHYKSKPHDYVAYIIQHESIGSLNSYLKKNLLALRIEAGSDDQSFEGNSHFTLFGIEILLTEKGYANIDQVIKAIFSVILMLKLTPIEHHEKSFMELKQIHDTSFQYREEKTASDNTEELAVNMKYYEDQDIICGAEKFYEFDAEMVTKIIEILNEGKFNLTLLTDKHGEYKNIEKWFGTEYNEIDFPNNIKEMWNDRKLSGDFHMPLPNEFICKNFDIVYESQENQEDVETLLPERVNDIDEIELWYKGDNKFLLPHGFINCYLFTPKAYKSARSIVLNSLYSMTVKHYLTEKVYPALCAGLGFSMSAGEKGLLLKLSGYNEKLPLLLDIIVKELRELGNNLEVSVFETYREQSKRNAYNNLINSKFFNRDCRLTIVEEQHHFSFEQYKLADEIKFEDLVEFAHEFTKELNVKLMVHGNFRKSEAIEIAKNFKNSLKYTEIEHIKSRARKIPSDRSNVLYIKSPLPNDKNSTITNFYQIGKSSVKVHCLIEFVQKLMEEPLFDILRTKEQLGYAVSCCHRVNNGICGFSFTLQIQENRHTTVAVNERIEKFLTDDFKNIIDKLTDEEFETAQCSLIKLKKIEEVEMESENNRLWSEITSAEYLFTRLDMEAEMIGRFEKREVQQFYNDVLLKSPKLSIQVIGNKEGEIDDEDGVPIFKVLDNNSIENENVISNVMDFKNSLEYYDVHTTIVDL